MILTNTMGMSHLKVSYSLFLFVRRFADCNTNLKLKWKDILILLALKKKNINSGAGHLNFITPFM
jgi:hypothetical protein